MSYDAFISYSHSADGKLAPAVQDGLQKLAKPWNKRRALRVFRDDTGLSANPALWTSIEEALDESTWFLLFLSPAAAESEWVGREIERWTSTQPAGRILPILTEGELVWNPALNAFDPAVSTALPAALHHSFTEEPRHLDLRWAHDEDQLDLRNSRFRAAIADLAAPIHGMPKDDLESEDIRQHRRAKRLARAAVVGLVLLLASSLVAGALAVSSASQAEDERDRALAAEAAAQDERDRALAAEATAAEERDRAEAALERALSAEELAALEAYRAASEQARAEEEADRAETQQARAEEEAKRATTEQARAEQEADRAASEQARATEEATRAERAAVCDAYDRLLTIEDLRLNFTILELTQSDIAALSPVDDANRSAILLDLWSNAERSGTGGFDLVAIEAMSSFPVGPVPDDLLGGEYFPDPYAMAPFERDYPPGLGEGPEAAYDYWDGYVYLTYGDVLTELDLGIGTLCREAGLL